MTTPRPLRYRWTGFTMEPLVPSLAQEQFEVGEHYQLERREERSHTSHGHYFACLQEGWGNLPEHLAERFPTVEHMRKWLLIRAGYRDQRTIVLASKAQAVQVAAFIKPLDDQAVVVPKEATVIIATAKSQSMRAMGKAEFQKSKDDVLDALAEMINVERQALEKNAGRAA